MYLLDTNVWSKLLSGRSQEVARKMRDIVKLDATRIKYCSIVRAELLYGAFKVSSVKTLTNIQGLLADFESIPFDDSCCQVYAEIRS